MTKRGSPYVYCTWVTGIIAGDFSCEWASWFRSNHQDFEKVQKDSNLTVWKAQHGEMLREHAETLKAEGWTVYLENQNKFNLRGKAATLGGCPDIVAVRGDDYLVIDEKTGKPKDGDVIQVLIYMMILPLTHEACRGKTMRGELWYKNHASPLSLSADSLTARIKAQIRSTIESMASIDPLPRVPSYADCKFCDIGLAHCPDRMTGETKAVETELF